MLHDKLTAEFLSDLCGREGLPYYHLGYYLFLSDLCGREDASK